MRRRTSLQVQASGLARLAVSPPPQDCHSQHDLDTLRRHDALLLPVEPVPGTMTATICSPPAWTHDSLTAFMDDAQKNRFANFVHKAMSFRLIEIDRCFQTVAEHLTDIDDHELVPALMVIRSHAAYRAACEHAMAGQVAETFPMIRVCLEYAGYGLHVDRNPRLAETFLKREDSQDARKAVRQNFHINQIRQTIENANQDVGRVFHLLYESSIDLGAHPNELSLLGSLRLDASRSVSNKYLHDDGPALDLALKSSAQTGVCALDVLREVFKQRVALLGVSVDLDALRQGL